MGNFLNKSRALPERLRGKARHPTSIIGCPVKIEMI
jgi:hypothetical protein